MLREAIVKLMKEYPTFDVKDGFPFAGNDFAEYIRNDIPYIFSREFSEFPTIIWEASAGIGQWADAPWIAAFNPAITDSAQKGYYPVFLFTSTLDAVYLSLNQGMTQLRQEFGDKDAVIKLQHNAQILRLRLGRIISDYGFSIEPIDLHPRGETTRLAYYQPGHAFGIKFNRINLPTNEDLHDYVSKMLRLYAISFSRGGINELDLDEQTQEQSSTGEIEFEEKLRYQQHRSIERNPKLGKKAKEIHGYICQVCGFNFELVYGEIGKEFIEAHHKTPLSSLPIDQFISLSPIDDFAVVCSNCHSMIHRKNAPPTFDEFVRLYSH